MKYVIYVINLLLLTYFSCSNHVKEEDTNSGVNIYFLQDEDLTFTTAMEQPLSKLILQDEAWISSDDTERYDWSTHLIYLKKGMPISHEGISVFGNPFLVIANSERCYLGALWAGYSSLRPSGPVIWVAPGFYPDDIVHISFEACDPQGQQIQDPRNDFRIKEALIQNRQFHAGLQCTLEKVEVFHKSDASSVKYIYTLRNLDKDNLYVLDPYRMGSGLFHYFTHGVYLNNENNHYWSENKTVEEPAHWSHWELSWHSCIKSGNSMTRTVLLEGYPRIVSGTYQCTFQFPSPSHVEKVKRELGDGRTWMGRINAPVLVVQVP